MKQPSNKQIERTEQFAWCIICHQASIGSDWPPGVKCPRCGALALARYEWEYLRRIRDWLPEAPDLDTKYTMP